MDKSDRRSDDQVPPRRVLAGPPWGNYVDPDLSYIRGQLGSVGSGALGGRSCSGFGSFVTVTAEDTKEAMAEARRILTARAERCAAEHPESDR